MIIGTVSPLACNIGEEATLQLSGKGFGTSATDAVVNFFPFGEDEVLSGEGANVTTATIINLTDQLINVHVTFTSVGVYNVSVTNVIASVTVGQTQVRVVTVIDPTISDFDSAEISLGLLSKVYIDGIHAGFLEGEVDITPKTEHKDYKPNDRLTVVKIFITSFEATVSMTLSQVNANNLALALTGDVGNYDSATKTITVPAVMSAVAEHTILIVDAMGTQYYFGRGMIIEPTAIKLTPEDNIKLPLQFRILAVETDAELSDLFSVYSPDFS